MFLINLDNLKPSGGCDEKDFPEGSLPSLKGDFLLFWGFLIFGAFP